MNRYLASLVTLLAMVAPALANSTVRYVEPAHGGLDYYWVPANVLLFHIDYPWDFILYFFAGVGFLYVMHYLVFSGLPRAVDWIRTLLGKDGM